MNGKIGSSPPAAISDLRPTTPKKLSTPAGTRLQTVLEGGDPNRPTAFGTAGLRGPEEAGAEQSYTTIWSDAGLAAKEKPSGRSRYVSWVTRRGGWKRLSLLLLVLIAIIVGLVVGLVVGLRAQSKTSDTAAPTTSTGSDTNPQGSAPASTVIGEGSGSQPTSTVAGGSTATPSAFPVGAYSFVTFLDTVTTDCTSNPATWNCPPYTLYSSDPTRAMTTFNWNITQSGSDNGLSISSISNPFQNTFSDITVSLMDQGKDTEHYFFQLLLDKQVRPTAALTADDSATVCFYNSTTFQASLYTKEARSYPTTTQMNSTPPAYELWPFAVKVEEVIGGGDNVPNCYTAVNNRIGSRVNSSSLTNQPAGDLCDCLYLNYL